MQVYSDYLKHKLRVRIGLIKLGSTCYFKMDKTGLKMDYFTSGT